MLRSTYKYPFEWKVFDWAMRFSDKMTGENRGFFIEFGRGGDVIAVIFSITTRQSIAPQKNTLTEKADAWLFYDPFDAPEYAYIEWKNITRETMERILGETFAEEDFMPILYRSQEECKEWPSTWQVMF